MVPHLEEKPEAGSRHWSEEPNHTPYKSAAFEEFCGGNVCTQVSDTVRDLDSAPNGMPVEIGKVILCT